MQLRVWWFAFRQLDSCDSKTPDVRFIIVPRLLDILWRHPIGCTYKSVLLGRKRSGKLARDAEVGQFDVTSGREKDVCG